MVNQGHSRTSSHQSGKWPNCQHYSKMNDAQCRGRGTAFFPPLNAILKSILACKRMEINAVSDRTRLVGVQWGWWRKKRGP